MSQILFGRLPQGGHNRKHPPVAVGDVIGAREVLAILPRGAGRNARVLARCPRGHVAPAYVLHLRDRSCGQCRHMKERRP